MIFSGWYAHTAEENISILLFPSPYIAKIVIRQETPIKNQMSSNWVLIYLKKISSIFTRPTFDTDSTV